VLRLLQKFATVVVTNKIPTTFNSEQVDNSDALDDEPTDLDCSIRTADGSTKKKKNKMRVPKEGNFGREDLQEHCSYFLHNL